MNVNSFKIVGGLVLGVTVGAMVGLFTASGNNRKARKKLERELVNMKSSIGKVMNDTLDGLIVSYEESLNEVVTDLKQHTSQQAKKRKNKKKDKVKDKDQE